MRLLAEVTFSSNSEECLRMVSYNNIIIYNMQCAGTSVKVPKADSNAD